jgi:putative zinc finger/helix-turn-helix YgiT family protein
MRDNTMTRTCPICDGNAIPTVEEREISYGRLKVPVRDEFMRCELCGDRFYLPGQMEATDRRAGDYAKSVMRVFLPFHITALRERLGQNRVQFEHLLGTGPKTDIRWEQGKVTPNPAVNALLFLLDANPDNVRMLAAWRGQPTSAEAAFEPTEPRQHVVGILPAEIISPQRQDPNVIALQPYIQRRQTMMNVPVHQPPYVESTG